MNAAQLLERIDHLRVVAVDLVAAERAKPATTPDAPPVVINPTPTPQPPQPEATCERK